MMFDEMDGDRGLGAARLLPAAGVPGRVTERSSPARVFGLARLGSVLARAPVSVLSGVAALLWLAGLWLTQPAAPAEETLADASAVVVSPASDPVAYPVARTATVSVVPSEGPPLEGGADGGGSVGPVSQAAPGPPVSGSAEMPQVSSSPQASKSAEIRQGSFSPPPQPPPSPSTSQHAALNPETGELTGGPRLVGTARGPMGPTGTVIQGSGGGADDSTQNPRVPGIPSPPPDAVKTTISGALTGVKGLQGKHDELRGQADQLQERAGVVRGSAGAMARDPNVPDSLADAAGNLATRKEFGAEKAVQDAKTMVGPVKKIPETLRNVITANPGQLLKNVDNPVANVIRPIAKGVPYLGVAVTGLFAAWDIAAGKPVGKTLAKSGAGLGGAVGGGLLGAELGAPFGPPGAAIGGITGSIIGAFGGSQLADKLYDDPWGTLRCHCGSNATGDPQDRYPGQGLTGDPKLDGPLVRAGAGRR